MSIENIIESSPYINSKTRYWVVRSGVESRFFQEFENNKQIALGWELIKNLDTIKKQLDFELLKEMVLNNYADLFKKLAASQKTNITRRVSDISSKIFKFVNELKVGDIIITPGKDDVLIGEVLSDVFIGEGVYKIHSNNIDEIMVGDLNKIRNVKWIKKIARENLEPNIKLNINVNHGISEISNEQVITEINRAIYGFYVREDEAHSIIMVRNQEEIDFEEYAKFIGHIYSVYNILRDKDSDERLTIKTNIQSPGPMELIGNPALVGALTVSLLIIIKNRKSLLSVLSPAKRKMIESYKESNGLDEEELEDYEFPFDGEF